MTQRLTEFRGAIEVNSVCNVSMNLASDLNVCHSSIQNYRRKWNLCLPKILRSPVVAKEVENFESKNMRLEDMSEFFPLTHRNNFVKFESVSDGSQSWEKYPARKLGVVLSGGQASGGHNVISGLMFYIKQCNQSSQLFGFIGGPEGIYTERYIELTQENINTILNQGGFDVICSGRNKIETEEQKKASMEICNKLGLHGLVVVGGDDSNTNAAILAEYFEKNSCSTVVVGCPKTIDGDLKNDLIETSFGYDTAVKTYSEELGNIINALITEKNGYYFVRLMGRSASHITLECGLQVRSNLIFIGEEIKKENRSLMSIVDEVIEMVIKRETNGKRYGIILLPEGLIEFIPEFEILIKELNQILLKTNERDEIISNLSDGMKKLFLELPIDVQKQLLLERDPHGNVQVAKIATEELLVHMAKEKLSNMGKSYLFDNAKTHYFGYEGRCALPSNFDANYCFALGNTAAALVDSKCNGYMAIVRNLSAHPEEWEPVGCPLTYMMNIELRKGKSVPVIKKYLVDLNGQAYQAYLQVKSEWKYNDYYRNPGPIQFEGPDSDITNYMLVPPKVEDLLSRRDCVLSSCSNLSALRRSEKIQISNILASKTAKFYEYRDFSSKDREFVGIIERNLPFQIGKHKNKTLYFAEDVNFRESCEFKKTSTFESNSTGHPSTFTTFNSTTTTTTTTVTSTVSSNLNTIISKKECIGIILSNKTTPGVQNVVNGLIDNLDDLKQLFVFPTIYDFVKGRAFRVKLNKDSNNNENINLGGFKLPSGAEFVSLENNNSLNSSNYSCEAYIPSSEQFSNFYNYSINDEYLIKIINTFRIDAMAILGDNSACTFSARISEKLLCLSYNSLNIREIPIVFIPVCIENSISHPMMDVCLGFDSVSRSISTLVGNLLTDSASATKYWYFMRVCGPKTSNLVLEVGLKTHPNIVVIPERYANDNSRLICYETESFGVTLDSIITEMCDVICLRSKEGENFGGAIISEGLFDQIYPTKEYRRMISKYQSLYDSISEDESVFCCFDNVPNLTRFEKKVIDNFKTIFNEIDERIIKNLVFEKDMNNVPTEIIISSLVQKELAQRKSQDKFNGTINPVCFVFTDQVKSCFPSEYDCNIAYSYGCLAGRIIFNNVIGGYMTGIKGTLDNMENWKMYAIPITDLLTINFIDKHISNYNLDSLYQSDKGTPRSSSRFSYELVCKLNKINLNSNYGLNYLTKNIKNWEFKNEYINSGPIQFTGAFKNDINNSLLENEYVYTMNIKELNDLLLDIKNSCQFGIGKKVLEATISQLRAVQMSIKVLDDYSSSSDNASTKRHKQS
ncbi:pyrophosphate-dependent 6-phosphofructokinase [Cryptosporidium ryanae]|uniref:pyrophosphate-dependent 6-phosphofructokinase n=1 Tax=Cryptosporidium ryanae TaxID=515981 RepID=UPI003519E7BD|nr:pyrophosphate-dependent 6-phosphofructokinase [Cryptosporidium ryanae]